MTAKPKVKIKVARIVKVPTLQKLLEFCFLWCAPANMQQKILFSPQEIKKEIGVDAPIHPHIPPEFTQPVKPKAIGSVEIGG